MSTEPSHGHDGPQGAEGPTGGAHVRGVLYPAKDLTASLAFYRDALGLPVRFTDGGRYAALGDGGTSSLALASGTEAAVGAPAATVRVPDVAAAVEAAVAHGARVLAPAEAGPHEVRAVVADPDGHPVVLYAPAPGP
ncbi:VOC family protein [Nocardiopsis sp. RSe5-2]|uniref:VOC family protein n=1 Tax=Nocardiopsis endophytica TaxID=3018445 RepID=A0ABT4UE05_9ACTN|nr:VOC family protein [Nocardiopsis endophytica]MDA2815153.1 VOC family protein [Nocardiopsis endophytica]